LASRAGLRVTLVYHPKVATQAVAQTVACLQQHLPAAAVLAVPSTPSSPASVDCSGWQQDLDVVVCTLLRGSAVANNGSALGWTVFLSAEGVFAPTLVEQLLQQHHTGTRLLGVRSALAVAELTHSQLALRNKLHLPRRTPATDLSLQLCPSALAVDLALLLERGLTKTLTSPLARINELVSINGLSLTVLVALDVLAVLPNATCLTGLGFRKGVPASDLAAAAALQWDGRRKPWRSAPADAAVAYRSSWSNRTQPFLAGNCGI
jgi:hypothetical protein